jgi:putative DNA-invertase from lambdoid prophage Rac
MAVYGYVRVSTDRQADEGESLDVQRRKLEGYAMQNGWALDTVFVERGVSGSTPIDERPAGAQLLAALQPGDIVLTPKLDRMFRSALDALRVLEQLKAGEVALHMLDLGGDVTGNGISKLVFTILSAVAEAERDRIRERIRDVKGDQRARGRYLGGTVPFGWAIGADGELVEVPAQQAAVRRMIALRGDGRSYRSIAETLRGDGFALSHEAVRKILDRLDDGDRAAA